MLSAYVTQTHKKTSGNFSTQNDANSGAIKGWKQKLKLVIHPAPFSNQPWSRLVWALKMIKNNTEYVYENAMISILI